MTKARALGKLSLFGNLQHQRGELGFQREADEAGDDLVLDRVGEHLPCRCGSTLCGTCGGRVGSWP